MKRILLMIVCAAACGILQFAVAATGASNEVDLAALARRPTDWPKEITLTAPVVWPAVAGGEEAGTIELPAGTSLKLVTVLGEQLKAVHGGAINAIPTRSTDLVARVLQLRAQRVQAAAATGPGTTAPAANPATPAVPRLTREQMAERLDKLILPHVDLRDVPIDKAIDVLAAEGRKADPQGWGVPIRLQLVSPQSPRNVTCSLRSVPLRDALKYVTTAAGLKYVLANDGVIVLAQGDTGPLVTREFPLRAGVIPGQPGDVKRFFADTGVPFPEGSSLSYDPARQRLRVVNTPDNVDLLQRVLAQLDPSTIPGVPPGQQPRLQFSLFKLTKDETEQLDAILPWADVPPATARERQSKAVQWFKSLRGTQALSSFELAATSGQSQQELRKAGGSQVRLNFLPTCGRDGSCALAIQCDVDDRDHPGTLAVLPGTGLTLAPGTSGLVREIPRSPQPGERKRTGGEYVLLVTAAPAKPK
jgi:hypothetical protein